MEFRQFLLEKMGGEDDSDRENGAEGHGSKLSRVPGPG